MVSAEWLAKAGKAMAFGSREALEQQVGAICPENCQSFVVEVPADKWEECVAEADPRVMEATTLLRTIWETASLLCLYRRPRG